MGQHITLINIWMENNAPLAYALGEEHHNLIIIMLGGHVGQLYI